MAHDPSNPRDYIDCFLAEMEKLKDDTAAGFDVENLCICTLDLFVAGTETTSTTLYWGLLYMIKYPEIQAKVQEEIDRVVGGSRQPSLSDKDNMPFTNAVIHEIQRIGNIIPINLVRAAVEDTQIGQYSIPKGTIVTGSLTSVLFDESEWEMPHSFNPGHFLDAEGNFRRRDAFLPFSLGKRVCLGEQLARMELFLFFSSLLQRFTFSSPAEKYGKIFSLRIFGSRIVVLDGYKLVKEVYTQQGDNLADRPILPLISDIIGDRGLVVANGYKWKHQRRFALSTLRNFGLGKKRLEPSISLECCFLNEAISNEQGQPFDPRFLLNNAVSNVICVLVFGNRFEYSDHDFQSLLKNISEAIYLEGSIWAQLYNMFPWLMRRLPGTHHKIFVLLNKVIDFVREKVNAHRADYDPSNPRDYIDCFLTEMEKLKDNTAAGFDVENLCICTLDLFVGGTETTSTTLYWGLLYMIKYPEIQAKVQEEIDLVVGGSRQPSLSDRDNMHFTNAVIHEIQRIGNIIPINVVRATVEDTQIGQYSIPKFYNMFPWLIRRLPGPHKKMIALWKGVIGFVRENVNAHRADYDPSNPRDYIDCFLTEMEKLKDNTAAGFDVENLCICTLDLFVAGTETTSTTLYWGLLYVIKYPEIQAKVQEEIDCVVGGSRQPSLSDKDNMPFTNAVIHEIQRIGNIIPINLVQATVEDTQIGQYSIPKGTIVTGSLTSVLFDESEWETPHSFNPGHFLEAEGNFRRRDAFLPFSLGKRVCLGEQLARMELFLFFSSLLQRFTFSSPAGVEPKLDFKLGGTHCLVAANGYKWKHQRRFALSTLQNFGLGKKSLEPSISLECCFLNKAISNEQGRPFDPHLLLNNAVSNVICVLVFGNRFEYSDHGFQSLLKNISEAIYLEGGVWAQ
ncbi:Cytochrome P450 2J2 [Anabarilius grahami]|uniref:Cytochrome P450 2J2 n=1 Tax=Anabarilius grahami TaxID=495550 RepID=A0A3N0YXJ0_ANAGA|nr:Cytochrome P450 2J2 [Anabarilius grahami]